MEQLTLESLMSPEPLSLMTPDELYDRADEAMLRKLIEDRRFEKKPNGFSERNIGDYACMWANTAPRGGLLVIGIRNDKMFEGLECKGLKHVSRLESAPSQFCPDAQYESKRIAIHRDDDGASDFVLLFRVHYHPSRVVRTASHKAFTRVGDKKKELFDIAIRQLQAEKGEVRFETEGSRLKYPDDFDMRSMDAFVEKVRRARGLESYHTREELLTLMHLGTNDGAFKPYIACDLLFAKDPMLSVPGCKVRFLRYDGEYEGTGEKWNAVKDVDVFGTIPQIILRTAELLRGQLREFSRFDKEGKFGSALEYPELAWHEAIVNACAHRSYGNGLGSACIAVKMFDDRLSIESPGPFPPFVNPNQILDAGSVPTNPYLMDALRHMDFVKAAREGTRRMIATMSDMGLPAPEFTQTETGSRWVHVVLRNDAAHRKVWVDKDVAFLVGSQIAGNLSSDHKRILNYVAEYKAINSSQALRLVEGGRTWHYAKDQLLELAKRGILEEIKRTDIDRDPKAHFVLKRASTQ